MSEYVTKDAWSHQTGRPDLIDEIADQFERPLDRGAEPFWNAGGETRWPRTPRAWRSPEGAPRPALERRAG